MVKALHIDAIAQEVREVEVEMADLNRLVGGYIELAYMWSHGDCLYVDEEGALKPRQHFFAFAHRPDQLLAGSGVVIGREVEGSHYPRGFTTLDPVISVAELRKVVTFLGKISDVD